MIILAVKDEDFGLLVHTPALVIFLHKLLKIERISIFKKSIDVLFARFDICPLSYCWWGRRLFTNCELVGLVY
jgi:hypothetical protein